MAALIQERLGVEVQTTAVTRTGEITVWVDENRVYKKYLPFVTPREEKVLAKVEAALA